MRDETLDWLLEESDPSVRYLALTTLAAKPGNEAEAAEARCMIMRIGPAADIIKMQNADGSFGTADRFYLDKYGGTVWTLLILAELAADPADPRVARACEFILQHSQDPDSGGFSYRSSAKTGTGLSSGVVPCLTGNMVYALIRLGYLDDERTRRAIDWITAWQRADDGIDEAPKGKVYDRYEMCWGKHTCHMGAAKAFKALAAIPPDKRSSETAAKIDELAEYFLKHHLFKKSHSLNEIARPGWLKPGFPLMYQTDIVELLGIFASLKIHDARLSDAISVLRSKMDPDGRWKLENSNNGKMLVNIEKKGKPSKWITLNALQILREYG